MNTTYIEFSGDYANVYRDDIHKRPDDEILVEDEWIPVNTALPFVCQSRYRRRVSIPDDYELIGYADIAQAGDLIFDLKHEQWVEVSKEIIGRNAHVIRKKNMTNQTEKLKQECSAMLNKLVDTLESEKRDTLKENDRLKKLADSQALEINQLLKITSSVKPQETDTLKNERERLIRDNAALIRSYNQVLSEKTELQASNDKLKEMLNGAMKITTDQVLLVRDQQDEVKELSGKIATLEKELSVFRKFKDFSEKVSEKDLNAFAASVADQPHNKRRQFEYKLQHGASPKSQQIICYDNAKTCGEETTKELDLAFIKACSVVF